MILPFVVFQGRKEGLDPSLPLSMFFLFPDCASYFPVLPGAKGEGDLRLTAACVVIWRMKVELRAYVQTILWLLKDMKHVEEVFWNVLLYQEPRRCFLFLFFLLSEMYFRWLVYFINFKWFPLSAHTDIPPLSCCRAFGTQFLFFASFHFWNEDCVLLIFTLATDFMQNFAVISCGVWTLNDYF